jgi:hypothetical protein
MNYNMGDFEDRTQHIPTPTSQPNSEGELYVLHRKVKTLLQSYFTTKSNDPITCSYSQQLKVHHPNTMA